MAKALSPAQIVAALTKWGVPFVEVPGWKTRSNSGGFGDVVGYMVHHTASDASDLSNRNVVTNGHAGLSGPLCNFGGADVGKIDLVAAGAANHAGSGDPAVLAAVQKESYTDYPPRPRYHHGQSGAVPGNSRFMGEEVYYGIRNDPTMDALQYRTSVLNAAAVVDALDATDGATKWTSKSVIGHKEWSDWKSDPAGIDMRLYRADVQWCLDHGPAKAKAWRDTGKKDGVIPSAPPKPAPAPTSPPTKSIPKPVVKPSAITPIDLRVDGIFGAGTVAALQRLLKVTADGDFGPATKKALQRWLGVRADGVIGRVTIKALQRKVGSTADGDWGLNTTKALQRYLNAR